MGSVLAQYMCEISAQIATMEVFVGLNEGEKEVGLGSSVAGDSEAGNGEVNVETLAVFPPSR